MYQAWPVKEMGMRYSVLQIGEFEDAVQSHGLLGLPHTHVHYCSGGKNAQIPMTRVAVVLPRQLARAVCNLQVAWMDHALPQTVMTCQGMHRGRSVFTTRRRAYRTMLCERSLVSGAAFFLCIILGLLAFVV